MKAISVALLVGLFTASAAAKKPYAHFLDFSQKGAAYAPLENLRFAAEDITYSGTEQVDILGKSYPASKYSLTATVRVQTLCAIGAVDTQIYEQVPANFEVFVAEDKDRSVHDAYVREMYQLWSRKEIFSGEHYFDFHSKDNAYILSLLPDLVNVKGFYFIWVNGRVIKVVFKGFQDETKSGWGVMNAFTSNNLRIKVGNAEFKAYEFTFQVQKKFLKLYESGFFNPVPGTIAVGPG